MVTVDGRERPVSTWSSGLSATKPGRLAAGDRRLQRLRARPWTRSFLGFSLRREYGLRRCIAPTALARFRRRARFLTGRHRGVSLKDMLRELSRYLRGWVGYFGFSQLSELRAVGVKAETLRDAANAPSNPAVERAGSHEIVTVPC